MSMLVRHMRDAGFVHSLTYLFRELYDISTIQNLGFGTDAWKQNTDAGCRPSKVQNGCGINEKAEKPEMGCGTGSNCYRRRC